VTPNRREFLATAAVAAGGCAPVALAMGGESTPPRLVFAGVDDLGLPAEARADLESFAEPVLRDVAWLAELPLEGVDPAFVFVPRG
jgi:hypothetical protein